MASDMDPYRLSSPRIYLVRMVIFLILAGFIVFILQQRIAKAFMANPGLNGLIVLILIFGIILALRQVVRLFREAHWVNALPTGRASEVKPPVLLAPMATLLGDRAPGATISTTTLRVILDSIGARLDEARDISRYLTGLLIFLGLLGTFWGLITTVGSLASVIQSMQVGADATAMFGDLKNGLAKPLDGMSISFTASLFGLAGSLILGFLDLQANQAQNRFYNELEENLTASTADTLFEGHIPEGLPVDLRAALDKIAATGDQSHARATSLAIANLADGIQSLVQHMRAEQQLIRDWVEAQADQGRELKSVLKRLASEPERH
ncbi:MAG: flagellar motor protein MotA [Beijerinckiaceae bacterium]|nr:MAG: flagellar motor protein MotA [Beijerinckiaceae bacterium]